MIMKRRDRKMNDLSSTIPLMCSTNYKDRFLAEYQQLKIRYQKLKTMVEKWDAGELEYLPTCPRSMYDTQLQTMELYLEILKDRAGLEEIEL